MNNSNVCILLVKKNNQYTRISSAQFDRVIDSLIPSPELAGSEVRYAVFVFPRKPELYGSLYHVQVSYGVLQFDQQGFVDRKFMKLARKMARGELEASGRRCDGNIINASAIFEQKRKVNTYTWTPSQQTEAALLRVAEEHLNDH